MRLVSDRLWAVLTVYQEARGESYAGKLAVAEVIRNRTQKKYSSNGTVANTVLRPYQFSGWNSNDPNRYVSAIIDDEDATVQECSKAWDEAIAQQTDTVHGAVLYYNPAVVLLTPSWLAASREVARVGAHVFFVPVEWEVTRK